MIRPFGAASVGRAGRDGVPLVSLEHELLRVEVAPGVGGRIVSLLDRPTGEEWLWRNDRIPLRRVAPGTGYDPEFYGGVDEQIPCDGPESIGGIPYPDHGELWTEPLEATAEGGVLRLRGRLPVLGFSYERRMELLPGQAALRVDYRITNHGAAPRAFLWKLHAALAAQSGDRIVCPAATGRPLDLAWSTAPSLEPFPWPHCAGRDLSVVPEADGSAEFLALTGLERGEIGLRRASTGRELRIEFDTAAFPCSWLFATYGRLLGHHTVVLEPATSPELTVDRAARPARLEPGRSLATSVIYRVLA